ncbi:MAG: ATP-dependent helicase HrpB [Planctomycetota bacterium]
MTQLPVDRILPELRATLEQTRCLVLESPPGSGKTTRVPRAIAEQFPDGRVVVLEPRRVAARAAARRVASEWGSEIGDLVGYQVRDDKKVSKATRVVFVTEGVLVRQLCSDPFLEGVCAVVLDEFHERHVETDLALSMLAEVRETVRDDLALVVMSATLDPGPVQRFLGDCPRLLAEGRPHPVQVVNEMRPDDRPLEDRVRDACLRALDENDGDVLAFLPGVGEIQRAMARLKPALPRGVEVLPLHGSLPGSEQDRALRASSSGRRVVLSTNVAESSVTVEGVRAVVDAGLQKTARFDAARGLDTLTTETISRAAADQRAGRAGRTAPGRCYRLWSVAAERGMSPTTEPEIHRADLASPALLVRRFAGRDPRSFRWFDRPGDERLDRADALLHQLGAIDQSGRTTKIGERLLAVPVHPRLGRSAIELSNKHAIERVAGLIAILTERPLGDERGLPLDAFQQLDDLDEVEARRFDEASCRRVGFRIGPARAVARARQQLAKRLGRVVSRDSQAWSGDPDEAVGKALLHGFPDRVFRRVEPGDSSAFLADGRKVTFRPDELPAEGEFFLALRLGDADRRRGEVPVRLCCALESAWLEEVEGAIDDRVDAEQDSGGRIVAVRRRRYFDLVLKEHRGGAAPDPAAVARLLADRVRKNPGHVFSRIGPLEKLRERLRFLQREDEGGEWPELADELLLSIVETHSGSCRSIDDLSSLPWPHLIDAEFPGLSRRITNAVPDRIRLPSGRSATLDYSGEHAVLAARLQEWFGQKTTPRIFEGRYPVLLHLLAPNGRPVQVTRDLESFWANHYPQVRSELRRRYPKHSWPEDPLQAQPESRPKRRPRGR